SCNAAICRNPRARRSRSRWSDSRLKSTIGSCRQSADDSRTCPVSENVLFTQSVITAILSPMACHADLFDAVSAMSPGGAPSLPEEKRIPRCRERLLYRFLREFGLRNDDTDIEG